MAISAILVISSLSVILLLLAGCVQPNSNLSYGACCMKSDTLYTCHVKMDAATGKQMTDPNGNLILDGCGNSCAFLMKNGTVLKSGYDPNHLDDAASHVDPILCTSNCNFKKSDCKNTDEKNTCYLVAENGTTTSETVGPICVAISDPCVMNNCTVMAYGKPVLTAKQSIDTQSLQQASNSGGNAFKQMAENQQSGLVGKVMNFTPLNKNMARLLKTPDWTVNTLRLGIGGQFSDYDRARYYLPPSDYYCPANNPNAVVDRYTSYLTKDPVTQKPAKLDAFTKRTIWVTDHYCSVSGSLATCICTYSSVPPTGVNIGNCGVVVGDIAACEEDGGSCPGPGPTTVTINGLNYQNPLTLCRMQTKTDPNTFEVTPDYYYCDNTPDQHFIVNGPEDQTRAYMACQKTCSFNQFKTCAQNVELLTQKTNLTPSTGASQSDEMQPFMNISNYSDELKKNYASPAASTPCPGFPSSGTAALCPALVYSLPDSHPSKACLVDKLKAEPRNYYKCQLPPPLKDSNGHYSKAVSDILDNYGITSDYYISIYQSEQTKPGPAGAKVFECADGTDCLSNQCDKSVYSRGSCFLNTGEAVDCGCHWVTNCELEYQCNNFNGGSVPQIQCNVNKDACNYAQNGDAAKPVLMCDYDTHHYFTPAVSANHMLPNNADGGTAHVYDIADFLKNLGYYSDQGFELATVQRWSNINVCLGSNGASQMIAPVCPNAHSTLGDFPGCLHYTGSSEGIPWQPKYSKDVASFTQPLACPASFSGPISQPGWVDTSSIFSSDTFRWNPIPSPPSTFVGVPDQQPVVGAGGVRYITTSRYVTWQNDNCYLSLSGYKTDGTECPPDQIKFPLIHNCQMTINGSDYFASKTGQSDYSYKYKDLYQLQVTAANQKLVTTPASPNPSITRMDEFTYEYPTVSSDPTKYAEIQSTGGQKYGYEYTQNYVPDKTLNGVRTDVDSKLYRVDKTWLINSFGQCQVDPATNAPVVSTYGVCKSCGTMLTLAYQPVRDWVPNSTTPLSSGYCPKGCMSYLSGGVSICTDCPSSYPAQTFSANASGAPGMYPDFGILADKINEYQSANILPVLDIREYDSVPIADNGAVEVRLSSSYSDCYRVGSESYSSGYLDIKNFVWVGGGWFCHVPAQADWLLTYLNKNHSAAIVVVDDLPGPTGGCNGNAVPLAGSACEKARSRIINVSSACPTCLKALQYPPKNSPTPRLTIADILAAPNDYPQDLNDSIKLYTGVSFDGLRVTQPNDWLAGGKPPRVSNVSLIVLDLDMSGVDMTDNTTIDHAILAYINVSRRLLQHAGWPSVWKLDYTKGLPANQNALYNDLLYRRLILREREMTLAGVSGVLLPPLDNGDPTQARESGETDGRLIPAGSAITSTNTPFCAVQSASTDFLHPQIMAGTQKILAKDKCACMPCTDLDIMLKKCDPTCFDGTHCKDANGNDGVGKCEPYCVTKQFCTDNLCDGPALKDKTMTCTALRSSNAPPITCNSANFPDCDILADEKLGTMAGLPQGPQLIGGMPDGKRCCLKTDTTYYTYRTDASISVSAEPVIFPGYGANTTDCGRSPNSVDAYSATSCVTPAAPLSNVMWTCTAPS